MDFKSILRPGDLFVSYWLEDGLMVAVGDHKGIYSVNTLPLDDITNLAIAFEKHVTQHYAGFVSERIRSRDWPQNSATSLPPIDEIIISLSSRVIPATLHDRARSGDYRRLIVFPDGLLHGLPIHLLLDKVTGCTLCQNFPDGVIYAPSASSYVYSCRKRRRETPHQAVVLVGDAQDQRLVLEAQKVAKEMPCPADIVTRIDNLYKISHKADILYIATHGRSPGLSSQVNAFNQTDDPGWYLLFDNKLIGPRDFFHEHIKLPRGAVVVLSACSVGHLMPGSCHELHGLIQAIFYAGAATVLAARWPILYETAEAIFTGTIKLVFSNHMSFAAAMSKALVDAAARQDLRQLMSGPDASTFFWGPFALFGCGD